MARSCFNHSGELIYGGVISGTGSLVKAGDGTLILDQEPDLHRRHDDQRRHAPDRQWRHDRQHRRAISSTMRVLVFDRSNALTYSGEISGTGALVKNGIGTLMLTGENTFSGGTTINAGILQIGNGGTTGSIVGDIVDNAVLVFDRSERSHL